MNRIIIACVVIAGTSALMWAQPKPTMPTLAFDSIKTDAYTAIKSEPFQGCVHLSYQVPTPVSGIDTAVLLAAQRRENPPPDAQRREGPVHKILHALGLCDARHQQSHHQPLHRTAWATKNGVLKLDLAYLDHRKAAAACD